MNVESLIKQEALKLKNSRREIEIAPDISENHIETIKNKYFELSVEPFEKYILVLSYTKTGFFFLTGDKFYFDNFMQDGLQIVPFKEIVDLKTETGGIFSPDKIYLKTLKKEYVLDGSIDGIYLSVFSSVFKQIIKFATDHINESFTISEQGILSSQLPEDIKLLYLQILCNYAYINDKKIDTDEYNAISKFSIRMELQNDVRNSLRKYMNDYDERIKTGYLLASIKKKTENQTGYWDSVKYCMMQDVLYMHKLHDSEARWEDDGFIGSLMEHCSLNPEQINTMEKAVSLNMKMSKKDANMVDLRKEWTDLIKSIKDTSGYVPSLFLFCSGSIYGIKSYSGFFKNEETSQKAINKQRELILQEIIINNQKAVNELIRDMNFLASRLEEALVFEDKVRKDYVEIDLLVKRIHSAAATVKQEDEYKEFSK